MKAIIQNKYGGVDELKLVEVEKPIINDKEILIEVHTVNISSGDMRVNTLDIPLILKPIMMLIFGFKGPRRKIRGITASGIVREVGKSVSKFKVNDRVNFINSMKAGCLAEYISLNEKSIIGKIDKKVTFEQSAPIAFGAMSAYHFINDRTIQKGQDVLIYGASGSVGSYALQLAKYYGGIVTAVSSKKNHEKMKSLGANHVIDYKTENILESEKKYDVIFDAVIKLSKKQVKNILKEEGKFLSIKLPTKEKQDRLDRMNTLLKLGKIKTLIDTSFSLQEYKEAHNLVYSKHKVGNVVINIKD